MSECYCQTWIDRVRIRKLEDPYGKVIGDLHGSRVEFDCPEHGHIVLDTRHIPAAINQAPPRPYVPPLEKKSPWPKPQRSIIATGGER